MVSRIALGLLLVLVVAGCSRFIDHEVANQYDSKDSIGGTFSDSVTQGTSGAPTAYEGSRVAKVSITTVNPTSPAKVRGNLTLNPANNYGYYGGAFYFPPGTLGGPGPKQQLDLDVARWDYGASEDEFGGLQIGADHQVRLIKGQSGQQPSTIGSPFSFQEGCWNWVVVYQRLTSDSSQRLNRVYLNGQEVVNADTDTNFFGHSAEKVRFGAVATGTGTQPAFDFYVDKTFVSNESPAPPPTGNACDPVLGGADPSTISTSAQTPVVDATSFLYSGDFPIQHGVSAGTIDEERGAVIEGKVEERLPGPIEGVQPLEGVRVSVVGHPEFGYTESRSTGKYFMAVNGGGQLRIRFEREDYEPVERELDVPWQEYSAVGDVVMTALDSNQTSIDLSAQNNAPFQVARGNSVSDNSGSRQATLFFAQGTTATMKMPDGSSQPITQPMKVRATEYTVGDSGPEAMPAELPPSSGYTYAVDYTVDQAVAAGATSVEFTGNKVISYTDNFLGMPVGAKVPVGYYDSAKGAWTSSASGRVIRIINNDGGIAHLAVTTSNTEATQSELDALEITQAEREKLAQVYSDIPPGGKSLWREQLTHFSSVDFNWARKPDNDVPPEAGPNTANSQDNNCQQRGSSSIGCEDQTLSEHVDMTGSKFGLSYRSDRSAAHKASYEIKVPLTDASPPAGLQHVELRIEVAGQDQSWQFSGAPNQDYTYVWDGKDAFGRTLQGEQLATVSIGYSYAGRYLEGELFADYGNGTIISGSTSRDEVTLWRSFTARVGTWDADREGLGGWTLDVHHVYDPNGKTLHMGDGTRRSTQNMQQVISTAAGGGGSSAEDVDATTADIFNASGVAVAPDGSVYYSDYFHDRVRRIDRDGKVRTVAGTWDWNTAWNQGGCGGDGGSATAPGAYVNGPEGLDIGPDGSLYIADRLCNAVRRVSPDGTLSTVAGAGGGQPHDVAVADDGTLFVANEGSIERIDHQGVSHTVSSEPPNPTIHYYGVDVSADGSMYFTHAGVVQRLNSDGTITRVAGTAVGDFGSSGDGGPATQAKLGAQNDIAVLPDGSFYIADGSNHRLRYVNPEGIITRVSGKLDSNGNPQSGFAGDGGPARSAALNSPSRLALAPGGIYVGDTSNNRVRFISAPLPNFSGGDIAIPSEDGSELYEFDKFGRHLRTVNALTGATLYTFGYTNGLLTSVTDGENTANVTQIQRTAGNPTTVVAPFGQQTNLSLSSGRLATVTNPNSEQVQLNYAPSCTNAPSGLLSSFTDPRNHTSTYCYDADGRLSKANDRGGGYKTLSRSDVSGGYKTSVVTKLGRTTEHEVSQSANGDFTRTFTNPAGLASTSLVGQDGVSVATGVDGAKTTVARGPDPRFGMSASTLESMKTETPGGPEEAGKTQQVQATRQVTLQNQNDPLSIQSRTDTLTVNGHAHSTTYNASNRRFTTVSPENRTTTVDTDSQGRPIQEQATGIQPLTVAYDNRGRVQDETTTDPTLGTRNWHYTYKGGSGTDAGLLDTITDPLSRTTSFQYDAAGRVASETLPGNRVVSYDYDANGNMRSVTPPSRPGHTFSFSAIDLLQDYGPPAFNTSTAWNTTYEYNDDHDLTTITRPDGTANGKSVTFHYSDSPARRLDYIRQPGNRDTTLSYSSETGNLSSITTPDNDQIQFSYDGSLPTKESFSGAITASASRTYDNDFRLASSSVNSAQTVAYSYDNDSLLTGAGDLTLTPDTGNGLLRATSMASSSTNKVTTALSYNAFGQLATQTASFGQTSLFSEEITQRDALGRIRQKVETTSQGSHTYDYSYEPTTGFLSTVDRDGARIATYGYDANGNRQSKTSGGVTVAGTPDDQDRLQSYGSNTYTYTEAGDLKTKNDGSRLTTYAYDAIGNLQQVTLDASGTPTNISYVLDGYARRIAKKVGGNLVQGFVYGAEALGPVAELDSQGNVKSRFVYATRSNVPDYMVREGNRYRIVADDLGSPRMVLDTESGQIVEELDYDEFGNVTRDTNPGFQPFGFAGGLYDRDTKLVRFGARDYDPESGRWTTKDPILFAGGDSNLYGYVFSDPVNLQDPSGLWFNPKDALDKIESGGKAVGGAVKSGAGAVGGAIKGGADAVIQHPQAAAAVVGAATCVFQPELCPVVAAAVLGAGTYQNARQAISNHCSLGYFAKREASTLAQTAITSVPGARLPLATKALPESRIGVWGIRGQFAGMSEAIDVYWPQSDAPCACS